MIATKLRFPLFLFLATTVASSAWAQSSAETSQESPTYPDKTWERWEDPTAVGYSKDSLAKLETELEGIATTGMMVVVGGKVLFEYGDLEQVSYVASVRKSILAMLYGKYVINNSIDLDMTLEDLDLDDVQGLLPIEKQATIEDLITARSGVYHPASNAGDNTDQAPERGSQKPGEYFLYNNWDFNAAGSVFELMTEMSIYDALEQDLAIPLGMRDFDRSRHQRNGNRSRSEHMAYHMHFSTRDMARLGYLMLREGEWQGREVIPQSWARKIVALRTPLAEMNPASLRKGPLGYGMMWWIWDGEELPEEMQGAYTAAGAYGQYITVIPQLDMVVAHKTAVPPFDRRVDGSVYMSLVESFAQTHR